MRLLSCRVHTHLRVEIVYIHHEEVYKHLLKMNPGFTATTDPSSAWRAFKESVRQAKVVRKFGIPVDVVIQHVCTMAVVDELNTTHTREGFLDVPPMIQLRKLQHALQMSIIGTRVKVEKPDDNALPLDSECDE